ncbi:hypothetical protein SG34_014125 [Thalassomonas viridans]|uniref:Uncharacterized protein n=1 Tax=Thalassomonas viridans TaxID=137584 RepID=A0AAF0CBP2_9GAMM|nr:hypothetical protein [Thalassomonas viridans]WDE07918.1 hypothetical protein SG34_014125 [Thalassomonas viridans]
MQINKRLLLVVVVIAGVLLWRYFHLQPVDNQQARQAGKQEPAANADNTLRQPTLTALPAPAPKANIKPLKPALIELQDDGTELDDKTQTSPWQVSKQALDRVPETFANTSYQTISFNENLQQDISVGDTVSLPLPDGTSVEVTVTKEGLEKNGDYTFEGNIAQNNHSYPVVITQGAGGTFGSIATSDNTYSITTVDGVGVIYQNPPLPPSHDDDFLIVPKIK